MGLVVKFWRDDMGPNPKMVGYFITHETPLSELKGIFDEACLTLTNNLEYLKEIRIKNETEDNKTKRI
jgi:hypothetical protein